MQHPSDDDIGQHVCSCFLTALPRKTIAPIREERGNLPYSILEDANVEAAAAPLTQDVKS